MSDPQIEKLLILQDRDGALQKIEQELASIPREREALEAQIANEASKVEDAGRALKEKEVERSELAKETKTKEATIARFRTQQLEVKKNDEYRALTQQIEQNQQAIAELEERTIERMLEIDETREVFDTEKAEIEERIVAQKKAIAQLGEREKNLQSAVGEAKATVEDARSAADENYLEHYDRVKQIAKRSPYVVRIEAHKCSGCHLRVSNEIASGARVVGEPCFCDQCARMVYA